ncbi:ribosome-associated translation inhibitor RaiA [bacterium]|nr:ribosome-associated translation inhibitor RaiA [bacterium]
MDIRIVARHFDLTPEIQDYAESKIEPLTKFFDRIIDTHVVLDVEKHRKLAEISMKVYGTHLVSSSTADDLYLAIDDAARKIERRLRKYKEKLKDHKGLPEGEIMAMIEDYKDATEEMIDEDYEFES